MPSYLARALQFLGYSYLLRVPILTWVLLIAVWAGSLTGSGAEPILRGIFDIASPQSSVLATGIQFGTVALAALLAGTSMGVSSRLVICNAHLRFRSVPVQLTPGLELIFRFTGTPCAPGSHRPGRHHAQDVGEVEGPDVRRGLFENYRRSREEEGRVVGAAVQAFQS